MHMWVNFAPVISYSAELWWATNDNVTSATNWPAPIHRNHPLTHHPLPINVIK